MDFYNEHQRRCHAGGDIAAHLPALYDSALGGDCQVIELGVRGGDSTCAFLAAVTTNGGHVWSCDVNRPAMLEAWQEAAGDRWTFELADDLWAAERAPDGVDVLFIDTSHTYMQTVAELDAYADKVRPGGVILLHDTELERPEASPPSDPEFPVQVAATEFADERGWTLELVSGCHGLGIIHVPGDKRKAARKRAARKDAAADPAAMYDPGDD